MTEAATEKFCDTVSGGFLDEVRVKDASAADIQWVESADLFDPVHRSNAS